MTLEIPMVILKVFPSVNTNLARTTDNITGTSGGFTAGNASNLDSGTVPDARFPATLPAVSGANLTSLNASNLGSGTVPDARFPATLPAVSGANLTNVDATTLDGIDSANFLRSNVADTASGAITFNAGLTIGSSQILNHNNTPSRDKIRVWNNNNYTIGMDNGITFGGINNDYAMTFQMNSDNDRGWWFGDASHTDAQGAMSVTTQGKLTVAHSMRLGYGESDTNIPGATYELDVSGDIYATGGLNVSGVSTFQDDVNIGTGQQ